MAAISGFSFYADCAHSKDQSVSMRMISGRAVSRAIRPLTSVEKTPTHKGSGVFKASGQMSFLIVRMFCPSRYSYAMLLMLFFTMKMPRPPICLSWAESMTSGSGLASGS